LNAPRNQSHRRNPATHTSKGNMALNPEQQALWRSLAAKPHAAQAKWFLNAFWKDTKGSAEDLWKWVHKFSLLDPKGCEGCDLDEFLSHKFLEDIGKTCTVMDLRERLKSIDYDKNKRMCISEFLLYHFQKAPLDLVTAPQGSQEELLKAQRMVDEANDALHVVLQKLDIQKEAVAAAAEAVRVLGIAEKEAKAAEEENKRALAELQAQEKAYHDRIEALEKASNEGGVVARNRAKNDLAQYKAQDPLPLRTAKINQEAAVRKAGRALAAAEDARQEAEEKKRDAEETARQVEAAVKEAERKRDEALAYLQKVKESGVGQGQVWWMQREMFEQQKSLPQAKQTMAYPTPE